jgi:hypothetical protein
MTTLSEVTALCGAMWPVPEWPEPMRVLWAKALADVEPDEIKAAMLRFYQTDPGGFRPTPGKLRALLQAPQVESAQRAWDAFLRAVAHYAGRPTHETVDMPSFADPKCTETVRALGGFRQFLGGIDSKEKEYLHTKFLKAYARGAAEDVPALEAGARNPVLDGRGPMPQELRGLLGGGRS